MSQDKYLNRIKSFFKSDVIINDIADALTLKVEDMFGIDRISAERLRENKIKEIQDLVNLSGKDAPQIKEIPPKVLQKWIKIAKVLESAIKEIKKVRRKVLFAGLDNAGKSSIVSLLTRKYSPIEKMLPTRGVRRESIDFFGFDLVKLSIQELGGQIQYREKYYFKRPELYFTEVDILLFIIDIQDSERFEESVLYLKRIAEQMTELGEIPPFLIVFHKNDPDFRRVHTSVENIKKLKNDIENSILSDFKIDISYKDSSVYDELTIMQMFSTALTKISETSEIIENILEEFTTQIDGRGLSLVSMDGLIFGSYTKSKTDEMLINNSALLLQTLSNFHNSIGLIREKGITLELPMNKVTIRGEKLFEYSDLQIPVYLWLLSEKPKKFLEKLDFFKEQLLPLINLFI